jgi:hypothetical protein
VISYKDKTLAACGKLEEKYRTAIESYDFFCHGDCPLCEIYFHKSWDSELHAIRTCYGCFMANKAGKPGCIEFNSYVTACDEYNANDCIITGEVRELFNNRANFFKKVVPILKDMPEYNFRPSRKRYFKEISRGW